MSRGTSVCSDPSCPELAPPGASHCPRHQPEAWAGSTRHSRLPLGWARIRRRILERDRHQCQWILDNDTRCHAPASDVDHIEAGDDHRDANLQALCDPHHKAKTAAEANAARWSRR